MGALFDVPVARVRTVEELPGRRIALVAHGGEPLAPDGDTTLVVGAEREGLPDDVVAACDATAHDPRARRVAERRDGGNRRPVRVQP